MAHSTSVGLDWSAYQALGGCFVVRRHEVDYLRAVVQGDRLTARTWVTEVKAVSCLRHTEIRLEAEGTPVARAVTTWVFVNLATGRPTRVPLPVMAAFGSAGAPPHPASKG